MSRKKRIIIIISIAVAVLAAGLLVFYNRPFPDDYNTFVEMRSSLTSALLKSDASECEINRFFTNYTLKLNPLYAFMFRSGELAVYLKSYESDSIDTATISQFEIRRDSGTFFDFTFMIRPQAEYSLPFFHGDALKALPGVDGALYMDFYSFDNTMDLQEFFGGSINKIEEAMRLAAPYWKNEGFGELTHHLDPYKSPYRFEIVEPEKATEAERQEYFKTVKRCFDLYSTAYLDSLKAHEDAADAPDSKQNENNIKEFVDILYEHDVAVRMGKMIFPEEDFDKYFLDGFWGVKKNYEEN